MSTELNYFEDIEPRDLIEHDLKYTVSREEILTMANTYDPAPFHLSDEQAAKWGHRTISAPGVLTEAICVKMLHDCLMPMAAIGLAGKELSLPTPLYAGDTLSLWSGVLDKRRSRTKPDRGIVRMKFILKTEAGNVVYDAVHIVSVFCRDKG